MKRQHGLPVRRDKDTPFGASKMPPYGLPQFAPTSGLELDRVGDNRTASEKSHQVPPQSNQDLKQSCQPSHFRAVLLRYLDSSLL